MDVQMRLSLETTYEAIVDAGINPVSLRGSRTGLFAGICYDDTGTAYGGDEQTAQHYLRLSIQRVAAAFDFKGGASASDTACASSFTAFYQAFLSLRSGLCDQAVVVGAAVNLRPTIALGFNNLRMTSQDGRSKCMDASGE
jgi:fatty acid synthase